MTDDKKPYRTGYRVPKGVRIKLAQMNRKSGIHWVGKTEEGIPIWEGAWRGIPRWFKAIFKCLGIGLLILAATFACFGFWKGVPGPAIAGTVHTFLGFVFWDWLDRKFNASMSVQEAAEQFGVSVEEFKQFVDEKGIRPSHLFNDEPVYNLEAFGDVGVLLRAAERPPETDLALLRPAGAGTTDENTKQLLRPVGEYEIATATAYSGEINQNEEESVTAHLA